jgi:hypothetical protein
MKYRIYVDEVGNPDLESSDDPNHRFLCLTGVIIELNYVRDIIHPEMEELKRKYFGSHPDEPVIFHRKEIINRKFPFEILNDPEIRNRFDKDILEKLQVWNYTVISVCMDKKKHRETYKVWRYDPYHYCLEVMMERYALFLERIKSLGDVMAESRGGKEDNRLKNSFVRLWDNERFQSVLTSKQLKVKPKLSNIAGLQLADLIAHTSRDEILLQQKLTGKDMTSFAKCMMEILQKKYDQGDNIVFGKKFL